MLNSKVISFDALICNIIGSAGSGFLLYYRLTNTISEPYDAHTEKDTTTRDAKIFKLSVYNLKGFSLNFQICFWHNVKGGQFRQSLNSGFENWRKDNLFNQWSTTPI